MSPAYSFFPAFNAGLNVLATLLLIFGYVLIKQGKEQAHKRAMLSCFGVSIVFLICYVLYHCLKGGSTEFPSYPPAAIRYIYYGILWSHILLAVYVPLGAVVTIWHGLQDNRAKHLRWAKVTFSYLALCVGDRCGRLFHALPLVSATSRGGSCGRA